jgi:hypothetical protein
MTVKVKKLSKEPGPVHAHLCWVIDELGYLPNSSTLASNQSV